MSVATISVGVSSHHGAPGDRTLRTPELASPATAVPTISDLPGVSEQEAVNYTAGDGGVPKAIHELKVDAKLPVAALTTQQLEDFRRDGFLILRGFYSPEQIARASSGIEELAQRPPRVGHEMVYFEDSVTDPQQRVMARIEKFVEEQTELRELIQASSLHEIATQVLGEEAVLFKEKINFKRPGGQGFAPHQDIQPGWDDYARYFISILVTIDPSTPENGCLELAKGHHTRGWLGERMKPLTAEQLKGVDFVKFPTAPGDVIIFDAFAPHQSAPNLTDRQRRNLYLTYNRRSEGDFREKYFADKRAAFPPDFERPAGMKIAYKV